ncbi:glycine cleavage system protein H, partial [Saccharothrix algeriensis]
SLGDIVFVQLPAVGERVQSGEVCGELESTKSVSDLYAPVSGEVVEVNAAAADDPSLINTDPYGAGWLFKVAVEDASGLLTAAKYAELTGD